MIGVERPKCASGTNFTAAISILVDEATIALEEALTGLTDEQFLGYPIEGRHSIVTIAMHCIENWDEYGVAAQGAEPTISHSSRFDVWNRSPAELRQAGDDGPSLDTVMGHLRTTRDAMKATLDGATDAALHSRPGGHWWYDDPAHVRADGYMRTTMHTMAHVRQIWALRGTMGLADAHGWPLQHWA